MKNWVITDERNRWLSVLRRDSTNVDAGGLLGCRPRRSGAWGANRINSKRSAESLEPSEELGLIAEEAPRASWSHVRLQYYQEPLSLRGAGTGL